VKAAHSKARSKFVYRVKAAHSKAGSKFVYRVKAAHSKARSKFVYMYVGYAKLLIRYFNQGFIKGSL
jgi:hypothetical protein